MGMPNLKARREALGLSQSVFASMAGFDRGSLAHYENGRTPPKERAEAMEALFVDLEQRRATSTTKTPHTIESVIHSEVADGLARVRERVLSRFGG